jgi:hypothetical protein
MRELTYGWTTEMIVKSLRLQAPIVEVPVGYRRRGGGVSKVSGTLRGTVLAAYRLLATTLRYRHWHPTDPIATIVHPSPPPAG